MTNMIERISEGAAIGGTIGVAIGTIQIATSGAATAASGGTMAPLTAITATAGLGEMAIGGAIGTLVGAGVGLLCGLSEEVLDNDFLGILDIF